MSKKIPLYTTVACLMLIAGQAKGVIITFQEGVGGYIGTQDTFVDSATPGTSYGGAGIMTASGGASQRDVLLRFDNMFGSGPGQIPFGSTITFAGLELEVTDASVEDAQIHDMLVPWSESDTYSGSFGGDGVDSDNIEASSAVTDVVPAGVTGTPTMFVASSLNAWSSGAPNYGWLIAQNIDADQIDLITSEDATANFRPALRIVYDEPTAVPEPGTSLPLLALVALLLFRRLKQK